MATTYDKASLVMIPSGYKDDKLYAVKPTDGSGDFTFSRDGAGASPATRVNASGLIEKGRTNELLHSNAFDNAYWSKTAVTISTGQADPNGGSNAFKIVEDTSTNFHRISGAYTMVSGNVYATSVTAKASGRNFLTMSNNVSAGTTIFNLTDGSIQLQESGVVAAKITDLGGGWYRCEMVAVGDKNGSYNVFLGCDDDGTIGTYLGDGASGVLIFQSQIEQGLVATDYIETTTAPVSAGLLGDMPRLDYSGGATCPSLLLEPSRVNNLPYSEYLGASNWTKTNVAITDNATTSPEGVVNAAQITENASGLNLYGPSDTLVGSASAYTYSAFLKQGSLRYGGIRAIVNGFANRFFVNVDLQEGTITDTNTTGSGVTWSYDIENYGNGWHRVWISATNTSGNIDLAIGLSNSATPTYASGLPYYTGTGSDYIYAYGAQLESGSYPTSYIPTYGAASTRAKENNYKSSISSLIGQTEGTIFAEVNISHLDGTAARDLFFLSNTDNVSDDWVGVGFSGVGSNTLRGRVVDGGALKFDQYGTISATGNYKIAVAYKSGEGEFYVNGVSFGTNYANSSFSLTLDRIFNAPVGFTSQFADDIKQMIVFPTRLTNAELAALTA